MGEVVTRLGRGVSDCLHRSGQLTEGYPQGNPPVLRHVELISVLIAVLAIGATLAGLIVSSNRGLRKDMREDIGQLRGDIKDLRGEVGELRERMAHLGGLLEGLREAITGRAAG